MVSSKLFGTVITFLCFIKIVSNLPTNSSSSFDELLESLGFNSQMEDKEIKPIIDFVNESTSCKKRHSRHVTNDSVDVMNVLTNTTYSTTLYYMNHQVYCLHYESADSGQIPNSILSGLPKLEHLTVEKKRALQDFNNFSHLNIKYLKLEDIDGEKFIFSYLNMLDIKLIQDWREFNSSLKENLWDSFKKSDTYRKKYTSNAETLSSEKKNSIDKIINLRLPSLKVLTLDSVIFTKNNINFVINATSTNLTHLNLNFCNKMIDFNHHFVNMKNLTFLNLWGCNLTSYKSSPNLTSITTLILKGNTFLGLHHDSLNFQHHPNLKNLQIINSNVYRISKNTFKFNTKLRHLDMSENHLTVLYNDTFETNSELEVLNLYGNQLTRVPNFRIRSLRYLCIDANRITELNENSFSGLDNLQILLLNNNRIHYVHYKTFAKLSNLQILSLSYNNLKTFTYQSPSSLKYQFSNENAYYSIAIW